jgi:hypothetical protein
VCVLAAEVDDRDGVVFLGPTRVFVIHGVDGQLTT